MNNRLIQVGIAAIRAPDGTVVKDAPIYVPATPETTVAEKASLDDFARIAYERMKAAQKRLHIKI